MKRLIHHSILILILLGVGLAPASAEESEECSQPQELDRYHLLRRLSLDLTHQVPSYEDYLALDGVSEVPEKTIDDYLASDRFRIVARRFHEKLLWPNIQTV